MAWSPAGHEIIGEIAYQNLTPKAKAKCVALLHTLDSIYPKSNFSKANVWADQLKQRGIVIFNQWHYIDLPYSADGTEVQSPQKQNLVTVIQQSKEIIMGKKTNRFEKALFLRMLLHFVGDAHQPLHCINRFSKQYPQGDRGGNLFVIQHAHANNLHQLWDRGVDVFPKALSHNQRMAFAQQIQNEYPKQKLLGQINQLNPHQWCQESYQLAKDIVYRTPEKKAPSDAYYAKAQPIVKQQLALAGYRLAAVLNEIFNV